MLFFEIVYSSAILYVLRIPLRAENDRFFAFSTGRNTFVKTAMGTYCMLIK